MTDQTREATNLADLFDDKPGTYFVAGWDGRRVATFLRALAAQAAPATDQWRKLALQFDAQRMMALWHLKAMVADPVRHVEAARKFIAADPTQAAPAQPVAAQEAGENSRLHAAVRRVLQHHGLTKVGDGVVEADLIAAMKGAAPAQPDPLPGMSAMNRTVAYCAATKLRDLGYEWDGHDWTAQEPDCWAILTPTGSKLVSPDEAKGRKDAYPLYTHPAIRATLKGATS